MSPLPKKVAKPAKDTVYIDVEDEITAIIEKLHKSEAKVVAFVLPKRAATMQSVVNLKLLKRAADNVKKNIVLITSDHSVLPLAGVVGLHVAKTLQSKPAVPIVAKTSNEAITIDSDIEGSDAPEEPKIDLGAPIGKLAGEEETIEVTDQKDTEDEKKPKDKKTKNRKLVVPNFDKFRLKLILGVVLLIVFIGGWFLANVVLPKATITIKTDTSQVNTSVAFEAVASLKEPNIETGQLPAIKKELKKSSVEKVPTTGKRDDGSKATGTMTLTNCIKDDNQYTVPAGTIFSGGGLNYVTTTSVTLPVATYQGSTCKSGTSGDSKQVNVTAEAGGSKYNLSARSYSSPAQFVTGQGAVLASGSDMSGGTTKLISIVAQADIDAAKQQALDKLSQAASQDLRKQFSGEQMVGLETSLENQPPTTTSNPELNKEATEVEVTVNVTFAMFGVKRDQVTQLIEKEVKKKIDTSKQTVQNTGLDQADIRITDKPAAGVYRVSLQTTVTAGPQLDTEGIKKEVAGKKRSQTQELIAARPGITDVKIKYSPFWVVSTPKSTSHITITFTQSNAEKK
jgi:hypothetical protein